MVLDRRWLSASLALALCASLACARLRPPPVVQHRSYASAKAFLGKVAVAPFVLGARFRTDAPAGTATEGDAGPLVERVVAEEMAARGIGVIPARDVKIAFTREGMKEPRTDPKSGAAIVFENFGATAMLLGEVSRFRERVGGARGATGPASVAFVVTLHAAPSGKKLWSARFDETQVSLSAAPGRARRYPGSGGRWLTAPELARFGARAAAEALVSSP